MTEAGWSNAGEVLGMLERADPETFVGVLAAGLRCGPDQDAVVVDGVRVTYRELAEDVVEIAAALVNLGVQPGERVALLSANTVEFAQAFFAVSLAGAIPVPVTHRSSADELRYALALTEASVLLVVGGGWREADSAARLVRETVPGLEASSSLEIKEDSLPELRAIAWLDDVGSGSFTTMGALRARVSAAGRAAVAELAAELDPDEVAAMLFTSGTETRPKVVMHTARRMTRTALARWEEALHPSEGDRVWIPTPMCHTAALVFLLGAIGSGLTFVTSRWFDGATSALLIEREHCVTLWPQFSAILQDLEDAALDLGTNFSHVEQVAVVGTRAAFEQGARLFPNGKIFTGYGSTELNAFISCPDLSLDFEERTRTAGRPFSGIEVAIADPITGEFLPDGVEGEIVVRGSCLFVGYYRNDEATAAVIDEHGWFHTGDLGVRDPSGTFSWSGRKKELIKVGGTNMSPAEVEAVVMTVPGIRHAAVVSLPDPRMDEVPVVFVERDRTASVTEQEIIDACAKALASYKVPRRVWWVESGEWPMSLTKVNKKVLAERARAAPSEGSGA